MCRESNYAHNKIYKIKSRISIEVDFENNNQPVIQILSQHSDDTRDALISHFLEGRKFQSRWATIEYKGEKLGGGSIFHLSIVPPEKLEGEMKLMDATLMQMSYSETKEELL